MEKEWQPTAHACVKLGISRDTLLKWRKSGHLKPGRHYRSKGLHRNSQLQYQIGAVAELMAGMAKLRSRGMGIQK